jgi:hypothetical protein
MTFRVQVSVESKWKSSPGPILVMAVPQPVMCLRTRFDTARPQYSTVDGMQARRYDNTRAEQVGGDVDTVLLPIELVDCACAAAPVPLADVLPLGATRPVASSQYCWHHGQLYSTELSWEHDIILYWWIVHSLRKRGFFPARFRIGLSHVMT